MKLTVKKTFRDRTDHVTVYEPGTILDVKDKDRAAALVERGLCDEYKGKKGAGVTLDAAVPGVPETPEGTEAPEAGGQAQEQEAQE